MKTHETSCTGFAQDFRGTHRKLSVLGSSVVPLSHGGARWVVLLNFISTRPGPRISSSQLITPLKDILVSGVPAWRERQSGHKVRAGFKERREGILRLTRTF